MKPRYILLTIDTIAELIKDYCGEEIPEDAMPTGLRVKQSEQGKLALEMTSNHWKSDNLAPLHINFRIKRFASVQTPSNL